MSDQTTPPKGNDNIERDVGILVFEVKTRVQPILGGIRVLREDINSIFSKMDEEEVVQNEEVQAQITFVLDMLEKTAQQLYDLAAEFGKRGYEQRLRSEE